MAAPTISGEDVFMTAPAISREDVLMAAPTISAEGVIEGTLQNKNMSGLLAFLQEDIITFPQPST